MKREEIKIKMRSENWSNILYVLPKVNFFISITLYITHLAQLLLVSARVKNHQIVQFSQRISLLGWLIIWVQR